MGQGECAGAPCIIVLVSQRTPELERRMPRRLGDFAVDVRETGPIYALGAEAAMTLALTSPSFTAGATIPAQHTCDGVDDSPALAWSGVPPGTQSFALIGDDPDAPRGTWVHWVLYDLAPTVAHLPQGVPTVDELKDLGPARQGINDGKDIGYGGPCPPPGRPHRYFFKLYALDTRLELPPRATKADVERAMQGHVLAQATLMGTYGRK